MEVIRGAEDQGLALGHLFDLVGPLPRNLDSRLDGLGARVHGQHHVVAKGLPDLLGPDGEDVIVKGPRAQRQPPYLLCERLYQLGVAVALVDGAVGRQEVDVALALRVPHVDALAAGEDDGDGVVVMSGVLILGGNGPLGRRGIVPSRGGRAVGGGRAVVCVRCHLGRRFSRYWCWCAEDVGRRRRDSVSGCCERG